MRSKKISFLFSMVLILLCTFFVEIHGAWLNNVPTELVQPDGTVVDAFASGDEFHNWAHDEDYFTIIQDPNTGYWCWAIAEDGMLVSTGYPIHLHTPQSLNLSPRENISEENYLAISRSANEHLRSAPTSPSVGVVQNLVIFIRFADQTEFPAQTQIGVYDAMFNDAGEGVNSLFQYFYDASYQQLRVITPFFPTPDGDLVVSYQSEHLRNYFLPFNAVTNPIGYTGAWDGQARQEREHALLRSAIEYVHDQIPADLVIDSDGDGLVDNVNFIIRGQTAVSGTILWPHAWTLHTFDVRIHGKRVWRYNFNIENTIRQGNIGILAHELAHSFGIPDFYRASTGIFSPVGRWELMSDELNPPQSISSHVRARYTDWVHEIPEITMTGTYTLWPLTTSQNNHAFRIASPYSNTEHFVVEYRSRNTGLIDSNIPGTGLLVYRVNMLARDGNRNGPPDELYVFRPNITFLNPNGQINNAFFSQQSGRTSITNMPLSDGQAGGLSITNIGEAGESISFFVTVPNGIDPDNIAEDFATGDLTQHDWITDPRNPWTVTSEFASYGTYSVTSPTINHNQTTSLELYRHMESGFVHFWVKTDTEFGGDALRFYVNGEERRAWSGYTRWTHYSTYLAEGTHLLTWEYSKDGDGSVGADRVWIDRVSFPNAIGNVLQPARGLTYSMSNRDITLNWHRLQQSVLPNEPIFRGYRLLESGEEFTLGLLDEPTFFMANSAGGHFDFTVRAIYFGEGEAVLSNRLQMFIPYAVPRSLAANVEGDNVRLTWEYPYFSPTLTGLEILRNNEVITQVALPLGTTTFIDRNPPKDHVYTYTVRAVFINPDAYSGNSNEVVVRFHLDDYDEVSTVFITELGNNYPNPFNPETVINFSLKEDSHVKVDVFNIRGQLINTLVNSELTRGQHSVLWNGTDNAGRSVASGIYFYRMTTDSYQATRKMIMLK